ncbi:MAG: response regulator [Chitinophagaceae bacterium]
MKKIGTACIIDDDKIFTFGVKKLLSISDFCSNILVFQNGEEAIKHLRLILSSPDVLPDVILLDLNMPVMDGWQFLDEFIKIKPAKKIKIYIVSSSIDQQDFDKAAQYEAVSKFITKPLSKKQIEEIIADFEAA